mgnify:CR=1 FL=1
MQSASTILTLKFPNFADLVGHFVRLGKAGSLTEVNGANFLSGETIRGIRQMDASHLMGHHATASTRPQQDSRNTEITPVCHLTQVSVHSNIYHALRFPRPPPPPFDIETMEPIEPPWRAVKEWIPDENPDIDWFNRPRNPSTSPGYRDAYDQRPQWRPEEVPLGDGRTLVLDPS